VWGCWSWVGRGARRPASPTTTDAGRRKAREPVLSRVEGPRASLAAKGGRHAHGRPPSRLGPGWRGRLSLRRRESAPASEQALYSTVSLCRTALRVGRVRRKPPWPLHQRPIALPSRAGCLWSRGPGPLIQGAGSNLSRWPTTWPIPPGVSTLLRSPLLTSQRSEPVEGVYSSGLGLGLTATWPRQLSLRWHRHSTKWCWTRWCWPSSRNPIQHTFGTNVFIYVRPMHTFAVTYDFVIRPLFGGSLR
jgi:hypothetical protein